MIFGSGFAGGFGDPENFLYFLSVTQDFLGSGVNVYFIPSTGFGNQYFGVYLNAGLLKSVYVKEGESSGSIVVSPEAGITNQTVTVLAQGLAQFLDQTNVVRYMETPSADAVHIQFTWPYETLGAVDNLGNYLSWFSVASLTGVDIFRTASTIYQTRRTLPVNTVVAGSNISITITSDIGDVLSTGSGAFPGFIAMSGTLSGSIYISAGAATKAGTIGLRWPQSATIKRSGSPIGSVVFNQVNTAEYVDPKLTAGTYPYLIECVSDTGVNGTDTSPVSVTVGAPPYPVTSLAYASGNASALVLSWVPSVTTGATYNVYVMPYTAHHMDLHNPTTTAIAGSTGITLPAVSAYPGRVYVLVRSVKSGVEEKNIGNLIIELDASGNVVLPRPNNAEVQSYTVTTGNLLTMIGSYTFTGEIGVATQLQLFSRAVGGSYNFASPDSVGALGSPLTANTKAATMTATYPDGALYVTVKAVTAAGVQSSAYPSDTLIFFSSSVMPAATGVTAEAAKG